MSSANVVSAVGSRWQSLIVTPSKLAWMQPPAVPTDNKYAWWNRLRQVPGSWVSSRGESERFLYYDGPTRARSPVTVRLVEGSLSFHVRGSEQEGQGPA